MLSLARGEVWVPSGALIHGPAVVNAFSARAEQRTQEMGKGEGQEKQ